MKDPRCKPVHIEYKNFLRLTFPVYHPSATSGADMSASDTLSLSLQHVMNWSVSGLIGNNNRNCKVRIHFDCHSGI